MVASNFINRALRPCGPGSPTAQIGLGPRVRDRPGRARPLVRGVAQALLIRELFPDCPLKYMPPTKHVTGDIFRTPPGSTRLQPGRAWRPASTSSCCRHADRGRAHAVPGRPAAGHGGRPLRSAGRRPLGESSSPCPAGRSTGALSRCWTRRSALLRRIGDEGLFDAIAAAGSPTRRGRPTAAAAWRASSPARPATSTRSLDLWEPRTSRGDGRWRDLPLRRHHRATAGCRVSFTLPVPSDARGAARSGRGASLAAKMGLDPPGRARQGCGPDFTFFVAYGRVGHLVDLDAGHRGRAGGPAALGRTRSTR